MRPSTPPLDTRRPFSRSDALAAGISLRQLRGPRYTRLFHDRYIDASVEVTHRLRCQAVLDLWEHQGHISHHSAAKLWKLWVPDDPLIHVSVRKREHRRPRRGVAVHLAHRSAVAVTLRGLRVSEPSHLFLEMARFLNLVDLVILGDSIVARGLATPVDLVRAAARWRGYGAIGARRAAALVRAGVESPMETRLRLLIVLAGLPEPIIAQTVRRPDGRRTIRFDLSYPGLRIAIEYDGRHHAQSTEQWTHDLERREDLDTLEWRLIVVTSEGIHVEPSVTLDRIVAVLRAQGASDLRVSNDDEWRRHFPGRQAA